jgi:hypothetical protein
MTLAGNVAPADAPALTEDALLFLIDGELTGQGVVGGTTRDEVREATTILAARGDIEVGADQSIIARHPPASRIVTTS